MDRNACESDWESKSKAKAYRWISIHSLILHFHSTSTPNLQTQDTQQLCFHQFSISWDKSSTSFKVFLSFFPAPNSYTWICFLHRVKTWKFIESYHFHNLLYSVSMGVFYNNLILDKFNIFDSVSNKIYHGVRQIGDWSLMAWHQ